MMRRHIYIFSMGALTISVIGFSLIALGSEEFNPEGAVAGDEVVMETLPSPSDAPAETPAEEPAPIPVESTPEEAPAPTEELPPAEGGGISEIPVEETPPVEPEAPQVPAEEPVVPPEEPVVPPEEPVVPPEEPVAPPEEVIPPEESQPPGEEPSPSSEAAEPPTEEPVTPVEDALSPPAPEEVPQIPLPFIDVRSGIEAVLSQVDWLYTLRTNVDYAVLVDTRIATAVHLGTLADAIEYADGTNDGIVASLFCQTGADIEMLENLLAPFSDDLQESIDQQNREVLTALSTTLAETEGIWTGPGGRNLSVCTP